MNATLPPEIISKVTRMAKAKGTQGWVRLYSLAIRSECDSHYSAAKTLGLSGVTPLRRRILTLEADLNLTLVTSDGTGSDVTDVAKIIIEVIKPYMC